jgi:hypothetical protein
MLRLELKRLKKGATAGFADFLVAVQVSDTTMRNKIINAGKQKNHCGKNGGK